MNEQLKHLQNLYSWHAFYTYNKLFEKASVCAFQIEVYEQKNNVKLTDNRVRISF